MSEYLPFSLGPGDLPRWTARLAPPPASIAGLGELGILRRPLLALFCSVRCPGDLILQTYDAALSLRDGGVAVASGFHSPMERECQHLLLRGAQPMVWCLARRIPGHRLPGALRQAVADGRLLLLSSAPDERRRLTAADAHRRNLFVAAIADAVLVVHAAAGSRTEQLCREVVSWGKPLLTLESENNRSLVALGARTIPAGKVSALGRDLV